MESEGKYTEEVKQKCMQQRNTSFIPNVISGAMEEINSC